ncbi:MAG: ATP-binding cassette domain-containing protein, partial [Myxococcota bacterium]
DARIDKEGAALGLSMELLERPFETLSGGERTRALIVGLFVMPGAYPLLDEPTNHLDRHGRELLADYLARQERGFVLVSHDRRFLDRCVDHVVSINRSDVRLNRGNFSTWKAQMDREQDHEQRRNARLERELRSMERAARNRRTWSHAKEAQKIGSGPVDRGFIGHRAAKQMKRALAVERRMEEALDEQRSLLNNVEKSHRLKLPEPDTKVSERLVSLEGITLEVGGRTLLNDLSLAIHQGERVALVGPNGCGKTSLLRTVVGELKPSAGTVRLASRIRWVRAHQIPRWQRGYLREHLRRAGLDEGLFRAIMGCLALVGEMFDRPLETFSQGERKKVELCRSLLEPAHLLIWDEPLNYVDIASREQIEALLLEHQPTLLCVEHDQAFIDAVATRVVELPQ